MDHLFGDGIRRLIDAASITALVGTIVNLLPAIASLLTIIWTLLRIYETETVQRIVRRRRIDG